MSRPQYQIRTHCIELKNETEIVFSHFFQVLQGLEGWGKNDEASNLEKNLRNMQFNESPVGSKERQNLSSFHKSVDTDHLDDYYSSSRKSSEESIVRPKSAAPTLTQNSSLDRAAHLNPFHSHTEEHGTTTEHSSNLFKGFDVMKIGARRSASTGIIGLEGGDYFPNESQSNKKQTSFMDLIQEDVPPKVPSPEYEKRTSNAPANISIESSVNSPQFSSSQSETANVMALGIQSSQASNNVSHHHSGIDDRHFAHLSQSTHHTQQVRICLGILCVLSRYFIVGTFPLTTAVSFFSCFCRTKMPG